MKNHIVRSSIAAAIAGIASPSHGAGFAIHEQGTGAGVAYANASAGAQDASTLHGNPAGLSHLQADQLLVGTTYIAFHPRFRQGQASTYLVNRRTGEASTIDPAANPDPASGFLAPGSIPDIIVGNDGGRISASGAIPYAFWHHKLTERTHFGLGVTVPFAATSRFNDNWAGRYHTTATELVTLNINPALSFKMSDALSVGAGLDVLHADTTLEKAVDFRYEATALEALTGTPLPRIDGKATIKGKAWGTGYNWGLVYAPTDTARFGLAYRSRITPRLKGSYLVEVPDVYSSFAREVLGSDVFGSQSRGARGNLNLPASLSAGLHARLAPALTLMADWTRTYWSRLKELRIHVDGGDVPDQVQVQNWRNSDRFAVGVNYALGNQWELQAGLAWDQTPVSSAQFRHPSAPDADRHSLALGASYQANMHHRFSIAFIHTRRNSAPVNYAEVAANPTDYPFDANQVFNLNGNFDVRLNMLSLNYTYSY